jgi:hypothetical protein
MCVANPESSHILRFLYAIYMQLLVIAEFAQYMMYGGLSMSFWIYLYVCVYWLICVYFKYVSYCVLCFEGCLYVLVFQLFSNCTDVIPLLCEIFLQNEHNSTNPQNTNDTQTFIPNQTSNK